MAGINLTGRANPEDYHLGRGKVFLSELDTDGLPKKWRFLGNAAEFVISVTTEALKHYSTQEEVKDLDKEILLSKEVAITNLSLEELNFDNLSVFFSGDRVTQTNAAAVAGVTPAAGGNLVLPATEPQGHWYELFSETDGQPAADAHTKRIYDIGTVTVEDVAGSTTFVEGADYEVNYAMGMIFVIVGGQMVAGSYKVTIAANASAASTVDLMRGLSSIGTTTALKFLAINAADDGHLSEWNFHKTKLKAEGDLPLIGDELGAMQLSGSAEKNVLADTNSQTVSVVTYDGGAAQ